MDIEGLQFNCPNCGDWYTGEEHNLRGDMIIEGEREVCRTIKYCPNHDELVELRDAASWGLQTPIEEIRCDIYKMQIRTLERQISQLEIMIEENGGQV